MLSRGSLLRGGPVRGRGGVLKMLLVALGLMWVEPMFMAVSLATSLCTRMVLISPSATHGQANGAVRAAAVLSWG
jgi:hypothetical protein